MLQSVPIAVVPVVSEHIVEFQEKLAGFVSRLDEGSPAMRLKALYQLQHFAGRDTLQAEEEAYAIRVDAIGAQDLLSQEPLVADPFWGEDAFPTFWGEELYAPSEEVFARVNCRIFEVLKADLQGRMLERVVAALGKVQGLLARNAFCAVNRTLPPAPEKWVRGASRSEDLGVWEVQVPEPNVTLEEVGLVGERFQEVDYWAGEPEQGFLDDYDC